MGERRYAEPETHVHIFLPPVGNGHNLQSKTAGIPPETMEGVDLLHVAGRVQASDSGLYPPVGLLLNFPLFRVAELSIGVTGKIGLGWRHGSMLLGLFGHGRSHTGAGNIRFGRRGWESGLEAGFWIPVVDQSILTWILLGFPSLSVLLFLGSASSQGWD